MRSSAVWQAVASTPVDGGGSSSLLELILDNLQLVVSNVHVRFEDGGAQGGGRRSFSAGVTLSRLSSTPTNANWQPKCVVVVVVVARRGGCRHACAGSLSNHNGRR